MIPGLLGFVVRLVKCARWQLKIASRISSHTTSTNDKVIANCGGVNPHACARELAAVAEAAGIPLKVRSCTHQTFHIEASVLIRVIRCKIHRFSFDKVFYPLINMNFRSPLLLGTICSPSRSLKTVKFSNPSERWTQVSRQIFMRPRNVQQMCFLWDEIHKLHRPSKTSS